MGCMLCDTNNVSVHGSVLSVFGAFINWQCCLASVKIKKNSQINDI